LTHSVLCDIISRCLDTRCVTSRSLCAADQPIELRNLLLYTVYRKSLACYNFDTHEQSLICFGRNVTDKVSNQKALYYATSNNLCFCTGLPGKTGKHENCIHSNVVLVHCQNSTSRCLISSIFFDSRLILTLLYDSLNLVINALSFGQLRAWFRRKQVWSIAPVGLCCTHNAPVRCLLGFVFRKVMLK